MSDELKWCKQFLTVMHFRCYHKKQRIRKKNNKRLAILCNYAFKRWQSFPYPPEWKKINMGE